MLLCISVVRALTRSSVSGATANPRQPSIAMSFFFLFSFLMSPIFSFALPKVVKSLPIPTHSLTPFPTFSNFRTVTTTSAKGVRDYCPLIS